MKTDKLSNMAKGYFMGRFTPAVLNTSYVEVAIKRYKKGAYKAAHYHKVATEITVIISGRVRINGTEYGPDDIVVIEPGESADLKCLENNTVTVVAKYPGEKNDKYEV